MHCGPLPLCVQECTERSLTPRKGTECSRTEAQGRMRAGIRMHRAVTVRAQTQQVREGFPALECTGVGEVVSVIPGGTQTAREATEPDRLTELPRTCSPGLSAQVSVDFPAVRRAEQRSPSRCTKAPGGKSRGFSPYPAGRCAGRLESCGCGAVPAQAGSSVNARDWGSKRDGEVHLLLAVSPAHMSHSRGGD